MGTVILVVYLAGVIASLYPFTKFMANLLGDGSYDDKSDKMFDFIISFAMVSLAIAWVWPLAIGYWAWCLYNTESKS